MPSVQGGSLGITLTIPLINFIKTYLDPSITCKSMQTSKKKSERSEPLLQKTIHPLRFELNSSLINKQFIPSLLVIHFSFLAILLVKTYTKKNKCIKNLPDILLLL